MLARHRVNPWPGMKSPRSFSRPILLALALAVLGACQSHTPAPPAAVALPSSPVPQPPAAAPSARAILATYVAIAEASYSDALQGARQLSAAIDSLLERPDEDTLQQARAAWLAARVPYLQTEAYRFGNAFVDEWEPRVNSWPLDEGLIDYVAAAYGTESDNNYFFTANIIANPLLDIGGISVDASSITPQLLAETLHAIDGVDANVATGYHAIEFLLWGQDLNGTRPGAGQRPATDYDTSRCSNGACERRRDYLRAVTALLITDLEEMAQSWQSGGAAYEQLMAKGDAGGLATMLTGMGSLAYGELAGERIRLGLLLHDPEEEQDCFSDNTLWSHYYDAASIHNVYRGRYTRSNGQVVSGASLEALLRVQAPAEHAEMNARVEATEAAMAALVAQPQPYDVLIASGNADGERLLSAVVTALMEETRAIERVINVLGLQNVSIEGSDSLPPVR
jgi:putative iron-regulated protein